MISNLKISTKQIFLSAFVLAVMCTSTNTLFANVKVSKQESKIPAKKLTKEEKKQIKLAQKKAAEKNTKRAAKISGK
jgi:hypothetical protein